MPGVCLCHKEIDRFPSSSTAPKSEILGSQEPVLTSTKAPGYPKKSEEPFFFASSKRWPVLLR